MIYKNKGKSSIIIKDSEIQSLLHTSSSGGTLDEVLDEQDKRLGKLESNVKWLYAYGGVGGRRGGGGGGDSSSWNYYVLFQPNGSDMPVQISDNTSGEPAAVSKGFASLTLGVRSPGEDSYVVTVRYDGVAYGSSIVLSPSNSWRTTVRIDLEKNSSLYIEYVNQTTMSPLSMTYNYVVNPFVVDSVIFKPTDPDDAYVYNMSNRNIYLEDIIAHGLVAECKYTCNLSGRYEYTWVVDGTSTSGGEDVDINDAGVISTNLTQYLVESTSTSHNIILNVKYRQAGQTAWVEFPSQSLSINVIPSELTLAIYPTDGLYDEIDTENIPPVSMMKNNNNAFNLQFTIFYGVNKGRPCQLRVKSEQVGYITNERLYGSDEITSSEFWGIKSGDSWTKIAEIIPQGIKVAAFDIENTLHYYTFTGTVTEQNPHAYSSVTSWQSSTYDPIADTVVDFTEGSYPSVSITPSRYANGWYILVCDYSIAGQGSRTIKYFYDNVIDTNFDWWPEKIQQRAGLKKMVSYRIGDKNVTITAMTSTSREISFNRTLEYSDNDSNYVLNVGIQYNETSDSDKPILKLETNIEANSLILYQNKIKVGSYEFNIFLDKTDSEKYDINDNTQYHLLTIVNRFVKEVDAKRMYEICAYVDGTLVGALQNLPPSLFQYNKVTLMPLNYAINSLELDYLMNQAGLTNCFFDDYVTYYYYTWKIKMYNSLDAISQNAQLLSQYTASSETKPERKNGLIQIDDDFLGNMIKFSDGIPFLIVKLDREQEIQHQGTVTSAETFSVFQWMNDSYTESNEGDLPDSRKNFKYPVLKVSWITDYINDWSNNNVLSTVSRLFTDVDEALDVNFKFYLKLQGTSTMGNKDKNFTLGLEQPSGESGQSRKHLFSPNFFYNGETQSSSIFLPETSFTLKADHVDSSHTNNVCMGNFVNEHTSDVLSLDITPNDWFTTMVDNNNVDNNQRKYLKRCLTGFPFYMVLETPKEGTEVGSEYYFLGVYNFNLGRQSEYNLGYRRLENNLSQSVYNKFFSDETSKSVSNGFTFLSSNVTPSYNDGLIVAEIQGNTPLWDFSQYDMSVLFEGYSQPSHMFDDLVSSQTDAKEKIQKFVERVAFGGGYVWSMMNKNLEAIAPNRDASYAANYYHQPGKVPDYHTQYSYDLTSGYVGTYVSTDATLNNFNDLLFDNDEVSPKHGRWLEYDSLNAYYITCMAFGMIDSVQKNLCIKSWNGNSMNDVKFGIFFYDMDTCLGIDNQGGDTGYFCFSDFYKTSTTPGGTVDVDGVEKTYYDVNSSILYRDFWPDKEMPEYDIVPEDYDAKGFDIPSSYLFGIAKYAYSVVNTSTDAKKISNPCDYWAMWRKKGGVLETADAFVDKYFAGYMKNTSETYWNLNYREKYLSVYGGSWENEPAPEGVGVSGGTDTFRYATSLKGRRIGYVRDWMSKRIDVMDMYMNLIKNKTSLSDSVCTTSPNLYAPIYTTVDDQLIQNNGENIQIFKCITTDATGNAAYIGRSSEVDIIVSSGQYSPLLIRKGSTYYSYILSDSTKLYRLRVSYSGAEQSSFGGSRRWTYVYSLTPLLKTMSNQNDTFQIISKNLDKIIIEDNESTKITHSADLSFVTPKVHTISLTSTRQNTSFGGSLQIAGGNAYQALKTIRIDGSKISLSINGSGLKITEISAQNLKGANELVIQNVSSDQTKLYLDNAAANKMNFTTWSNDGSISLGNTPNYINIKPNELIVYAKDGSENARLNIDNIQTLNVLTFKGFKYVSIKNCPNLNTITCDDDKGGSRQLLTSFDLNGSSVSSIKLNACSNLERLNLLNNGYLENVEVYDMPEISSTTKNLTYLDIGKTQLSTIKWNGREAPEGWLDLRYCNLNIDLRCTSNEVIKTIIGYNEENNPMPNLGPFTTCTSLERVYGYFHVGAGTFNGCSSFSLHGRDINTVTWKGVNVLASNGRVKHPYEIISGSESEYVSPTLSNSFQTGDTVSNIKIVGPLTSAFYATTSSIFDVYYSLWMVGLAENCTVLNTVWYGSKCQYKFTSQTNNSPNIYMFKECGNVTSMTLAFNSLIGGIIHAKDELFEPLRNLTSLSSVLSGNFACSQNILSTLTKLTTITTFSPLYILGDYNGDGYLPYSILNSPEALAAKVNEGGEDNFGVFEKILKNNPLVTTLTYFMRNCYYLKYREDYGQFIPSGITVMRQDFMSQYADGKFPNRIANWFKNPSIVSGLCTCFFATNAGEPIETNVARSGATLYLTNQLLNGLPNLTHLTYDSVDVDPVGGTTTNSGGLNSGLSYKSTFCGNGIIKIIPADGNGDIDFPFDILKGSCPKLKYVTGLFCDSKPGNGYIPSASHRPKLPGDIFSGMTELIRLDYFFTNLGFDYELSSLSDNRANFSDCTNLTHVKYMFANDVPIAYGSSSTNFLSKTAYTGDSKQKNVMHLKSSIPYKFFYHGEHERTVTFTGNTEGPDSGGTYHNVSAETLTYTTYNKGIVNMDGCFMSSDMGWYNFDRYFDDEPIENEDYIPFPYYKSGNIWKERPNDGIHDVRYTVKWLYDGRWDYSDSASGDVFHRNETSIYELDSLEDVIEISGNSDNMFSSYITVFNASSGQRQLTFFCLPPDLFRYSEPNCSIDYMFYHCGCYTTSWANGLRPDMTYGMIGRLCPWIFSPLTGITSTVGLFSHCKRLLAYGYNNDIHGYEESPKYIIPIPLFANNSKINNMSNMFEGICLPNSTQITSDIMNGVSTGNTLNVYRMFFQVRHGDYNVSFTSGTNTVIGGLFKNHYILNCTACFAQGQSDNPSELGASPQGCVDFSAGNFKSIYASDSYMYSDNFKNVYEYYNRNTASTIYVKFKAYNQSTRSRDLPDNDTTNNYWPNDWSPLDD